MRLALAQLRLTASLEENLLHALSAMEMAAKEGAELIFFPEIQLSPFFPQYAGRDVSEYLVTLEHEAIRRIRDKCRELHIMASPNVYLSFNGSRFDASLFISAEGELLGISKMVHITQAPQFYEQDYYTPSDDGFKVYDTPFGKVGIVICFDRHLPESIRTCALRDAQLILIPTANTTEEPMELFEWELRVQAMHSSVYVAMCNRVGQEGDMCFAGESLVADPNGDTLCKADASEQILLADIDLPLARAVREEKPYFRLRRPEMYA